MVYAFITVGHRWTRLSCYTPIFAWEKCPTYHRFWWWWRGNAFEFFFLGGK